MNKHKPNWTSISIEVKVKERLEKYADGKESWNRLLIRLMDELDYCQELRKRYRLR